MVIDDDLIVEFTDLIIKAAEARIIESVTDELALYPTTDNYGEGDHLEIAHAKHLANNLEKHIEKTTAATWAILLVKHYLSDGTLTADYDSIYDESSGTAIRSKLPDGKQNDDLFLARMEDWIDEVD